MKERIVCFGAEHNLVGIITEPNSTEAPATNPGFILINSGIVHHVGPNRLYVKAARRLAASGYPVFRFDLSGIGDSITRSDSLSFEKSAVSETIEAINFFKNRMGIERLILAGICSGADISFMAARESPEVIGAVLINGRGFHGVTNDAGDAIASHLKQTGNARYLLKIALFNPESWKKLIRGRVDFAETSRLIGHLFMSRFGLGNKQPAEAQGVQKDFHALLKRGVRLLLVYSEGDPGLDYLGIMLGNQLEAFSHFDNFGRVLIQGADHTFTPLKSQDDLIELMRDLANSCRK